MSDDTKDLMVTSAAKTLEKLTTLLLKEGARGAVLLGAARLDASLEKLLIAIMQPHPGGEDNLFDPDRPLGSFSAKIALAYRLGLIEKSVEHALQMIRKVRNDFAHSFEDATLAGHSHQNRLSKPYADARKSPVWKVIEPIFATQANVTTELRDYICLIVTLVSIIDAFAQIQEPMKLTKQVRLSN